MSKTTSDISPSADEAVACTAILLACVRSNELDPLADNVVLEHVLRYGNIFQGNDITAIKERAAEWYEQAGSPEALIEAAAPAVSAHTALPLFYQCLDVILADGVITPLEHKTFQFLKRKLRISESAAWKGVEVLEIKRKL